MAEQHLKFAAAAVGILIGCTACTAGAPTDPGNRPTAPTDAPNPTATAPTAPTADEVAAILADYDKRNNAAIAGKADWSTADGGVVLIRDHYADKVKARYYQNKGKKVPVGEPQSTTLIDMLGWSADDGVQTLIITQEFSKGPELAVYVKQHDTPWRKWVGMRFPSGEKLPKPAAGGQAVLAADAVQVKAINTYRSSGSKPSGVTLDSTFVRFFPVLKGGNNPPGFRTSRRCSTSTDDGVTSAWHVPTASGDLSVVANRCIEKARVIRSGYWMTWNGSDDKVFGIAGTKLRRYECELSGPTVTVTNGEKQRWYGPGFYRLGKCEMTKL